MDPGFQNRIGSRFYSVRFSDKADSIAPAGPPDPEWVRMGDSSEWFHPFQNAHVLHDGGKHGGETVFLQDGVDAADLATCHCGMKVFKHIQDFILTQGKAAGKFRVVDLNFICTHSFIYWVNRDFHSWKGLNKGMTGKGPITRRFFHYIETSKVHFSSSMELLKV